MMIVPQYPFRIGSARVLKTFKTTEERQEHDKQKEIDKAEKPKKKNN